MGAHAAGPLGRGLRRAPAPPAAAEPELAGRTRARALAPPPSLGTGEVAAAEITPAYASADNALPVFPPFVLAAGCAGGIVRVRLFVGADGGLGAEEFCMRRSPHGTGAGFIPAPEPDGNVTGSEDLPPAADAESRRPAARCAAALAGAVHAAVSRWRFAPSFRVAAIPRPPRSDGRPSLPDWVQTPIPVYLDYEFTFEVVDGRPGVSVR